MPTTDVYGMGIALNGHPEKVARAFVTARREARALASYPGERPTDLAEAYAIQDAALAVDGRRVAGWKVGRINPPYDASLGANRLSGPIFADVFFEAPVGEVSEMPIYADGFAAAEAEILMHVAAGWDGGLPADDIETRALIDDVRMGIEIASSPYVGINDEGPCVTISDFGNNMGSVAGAPFCDWRELDLCAIPVSTVIDGVVVGEATAASMLDGPYGAVRFLLENLRARRIDANRGLWVSTGAITGVHPVAAGQHVVARFAGKGAVHCRTVKARPREN